MIQGLYQSAAGMMVNEYRQDVVANNLANADTTGFKRQIATFAERIPARLTGRYDGPSKDVLNALSGGAWLGRTDTDFLPGAMQRTDRPLDVAIDGAGFFLVESNGQPLLTRDGRFLMDADGRLVAASDGAAVLGEGGIPVRLNPLGGAPAVDEDGRILQDGAVTGRLGRFDVANYDALQHAGASRFVAPADRAAVDARVQSNFIESSGVEPVKELVTMLEASRAYQINAQMITLQDQTASRLINVVASA